MRPVGKLGLGETVELAPFGDTLANADRLFRQVHLPLWFAPECYRRLSRVTACHCLVSSATAITLPSVK